MLELDEPIAATVASWRDDPWKRRVTLRMLLALTSGFAFGGLGASVPEYDRALAMPLRDEPGTRFTYGGIPLQVFGAVLARKLGGSARSPHEYLRERVLEPAGVRVASWRRLSDGTQPLPTGASLCVDDWLAYGRFVFRHREQLAASFKAPANPRYGLAVARRAGAPPGVVYAERFGRKGPSAALYPIARSLRRRFRARAHFRHEAFLKRLVAA